jgi:DNA-3-methyladenine glycosylase II
MRLTAKGLRESLDALARLEPGFAAALAVVGYPKLRYREPGFAALLHTIVAFGDAG